MDKKLLQVAEGKAAADLVITNGKIVDVYTGEIYEGGVAIAGDKIAAVGDVAYAIGEGTTVMDAEGAFLTPGFLDGHIHPESSSLSIRSFAQIVLQHGTTGIMTDLHEIGVVGGLEAIEAVLDEAKDTDLQVHFIVPSHVPFAPNLETSGGHFNPEIIRKALDREDAVGLSECVAGYIATDYDELFEAMDETRARGGMTLQGHLPHATGPMLNKCVAAGIFTDHEAFEGNQIIDLLRHGVHAMMREGSVARGLVPCLKPVLEKGIDTSRLSIVTDDLHTVDAVRRGHLDDHLRTAFSIGLPFVKGIQMVTLNCARAFKMDDVIGGLAPGRRADINFTTGAEDFKVLKTIAGGKLVSEGGRFLNPYPVAEHKPCLLNTTRLKNPITPDSFNIYTDKDAKAADVVVIQTMDWIPIGVPRHEIVPVKDGVVQCDVEKDVLYVSQVERYGINGNIGNAFMGGFNLKRGAIASSVGHDNHNIIVLGTNHEDMAVAVNRLIDIGGGTIVVDAGEVLQEIAYPVCGLLSDLPAEELAARKEEMIAKIHEMGSNIFFPFMFLSFLCLAAMGGKVITDHGLIDCDLQQPISPILSIEK